MTAKLVSTLAIDLANRLPYPTHIEGSPALDASRIHTMTTAERATRKAERAATEVRIQAKLAETRAIVATGKCPQCGSKLRRNSSLAGWYQCEQYGAPGFRARSNEAPCNWQGFTE